MEQKAADADLRDIFENYADEIRRCRYGSFRGVIKDGKVVIFALEHEWRPQLDGRNHNKEAEEAAN